MGWRWMFPLGNNRFCKRVFGETEARKHFWCLALFFQLTYIVYALQSRTIVWDSFLQRLLLLMISCPPSKELSKVGMLRDLGLIFSRVTLIMGQLNWSVLALISRAAKCKTPVLRTGGIDPRESKVQEAQQIFLESFTTARALPEPHTYIWMWCDK